MLKDKFLRRRPREKNPRKRPRRMKMPVGAETVGLFARIDARASRWLDQEATRNHVTVARMLSRILLERMNRSSG